MIQQAIFIIHQRSFPSRARKGNHLHLLDKPRTARTLDAEDDHDVTSFIKNVIYNGKSDEDVVSLEIENRIREYDKL